MMQTVQKSISFKSIFFLICLCLICGILLVSVNLAFSADEGAPAQVIGSNQIYSGPHTDYNVIGSLVIGDNVKVLARNPSGTMAFVWSDKGDGWYPSWAVDMHGANFSALPVWTNPMKGAVLAQAPEKMGMQAVVLSSQQVVTGPDINYNAIGSQVVGDQVKVLARNPAGTMVFIWSDKADGWFPSWAVDMRGANFNALPVWEVPMKGAILTTSS